MTDVQPGEPPGNWFTDQLLTLDDLGRLREPPPLYRAADGRPLLYRGTLAQLSGGYGAFKSFVAIDAACSVASGLATGVPEGVAFVAAEGAAGLRKRILAWCEVRDVDVTTVGAHLRVFNGAIQLGSAVDMAAVKDHAVNHRPALLVVDTRAKCSIGVEENSPTEQGSLIRAVEGVVDASGATALVVHHTGKNGTDRGTNAWPSGAWSHLILTKSSKGDYTARIECEKHKDAPSGCKHDVQLVRHQLPEKAVSPRRPDETDADYDERRYTLAVAGTERKSSRSLAQRVAALDLELDRLEVPRSAGAPTVRAALRTAGISAPNDVIAAVVRERKTHPIGLSVDLSKETCPTGSSTDSGQRTDSHALPQVDAVRDTDGQLRTAPCPSVSPPIGGDGQGGQEDSGQGGMSIEQDAEAAEHHADEASESGMVPEPGSSIPDGKELAEEEPQGDDGASFAAAISEARQDTQPHADTPAPTATTEPNQPGDGTDAATAAQSCDGDVGEPVIRSGVAEDAALPARVAADGFAIAAGVSGPDQSRGARNASADSCDKALTSDASSLGGAVDVQRPADDSTAADLGMTAAAYASAATRVRTRLVDYARAHGPATKSDLASRLKGTKYSTGCGVDKIRASRLLGPVLADLLRDGTLAAPDGTGDGARYTFVAGTRRSA